MTLIQVCLGLLKSGEELKNQEEVDMRKKQSLMFSRDIIPKPDIRLFTEHFLSSPTVVGVSINLKRISYAKVTTTVSKFNIDLEISWRHPSVTFMSRCSDFHMLGGVSFW